MKYCAVVVLIALQLAPQIVEAGPIDGIVNMPAACRNKSYCFEKHPGYPQDIVDEILDKLNISLLDGMERTEQRTLSSPDDVCVPDRRNDSIYEIVDEKKRVRVVLQSENFTQIISVESCSNSKPNLYEFFTMGEIEAGSLSCIEETIKYPFLVLSLNGESVDIAISEIPVCCSCRYIHKKKTKGYRILDNRDF